MTSKHVAAQTRRPTKPRKVSKRDWEADFVCIGCESIVIAAVCDS